MPTTAESHAAFLAAICDAPESMTPRLMYADWLEEHGDPDRAEFIRVQCEIAELRLEEIPPHPACDCCPTGSNAPHQSWCRSHRWVLKYLSRQYRGDQLRRRESALLDAHRGDWFRLLSRRPGFGEGAPLRWWPVASNDEELADRGPGCPTLSAAIEGTPRRGFLEHVELAATDWLRHADTLVKAAPIREVSLTTAVDWWCPGNRNTLALGEPGGQDRYRCKRVGYGDWWGWGPHAHAKIGTTVTDFILCHEWPGITFRLPAVGR